MDDEGGSFLAGIVLGGLFGYQYGHNTLAGWEEVAKKFNERLAYLKYYKVIMPVQLLGEEKELQVLYREAVNSFLLGMPNGSLPLMVRVLEASLKSRYNKEEGKETKMDLNGLINWSEKFLGDKKELAHGFRIVRNLIHEKTLISEQSSLDGIRYITEIINLLYPFESAEHNPICPFCRYNGPLQSPKDSLFIGNEISIKCGDCQKVYGFVLMP